MIVTGMLVWVLNSTVIAGPMAGITNRIDAAPSQIACEKAKDKLFQQRALVRNAKLNELTALTCSEMEVAVMRPGEVSVPARGPGFPR